MKDILDRDIFMRDILDTLGYLMRDILDTLGYLIRDIHVASRRQPPAPHRNCQ